MVVGSMWAKFKLSATKIVACRLLTDRLTHTQTHKHTDMTDYMIVANLRLATITTPMNTVLVHQKAVLIGNFTSFPGKARLY